MEIVGQASFVPSQGDTAMVAKRCLATAPLSSRTEGEHHRVRRAPRAPSSRRFANFGGFFPPSGNIPGSLFV